MTRVEDVTGFPELLEGRVKTLHPRIHAGILARRDRPDDVAALAEHSIEPFDLVCVSLYPFEVVAHRIDTADEDVIEMIDVGGPSLLRAAAKNHAHVVVVCRPEDYEPVLAELRERAGTTSPETRRRLASVAFATTAAYDSSISRWFQGDGELPQTRSFPRSTACSTSRTARTRIRARRTTPSAAGARTCSRASSSSAASRSRSTTSTTSRRAGCSRVSSTIPPA